MTRSFSFHSATTALPGVLAFLVLMCGPAQAGFEWTAPAAKPRAAAVSPGDPLPPVPALPSINVEASYLGEPPAIGMRSTSADPRTMPRPPRVPVMQPANDMPAGGNARIAPVQSQAISPAIDVGMDNMPAHAMMKAAPHPMPVDNGVYAEAVGFGADMPLVLALRQVVPAEYAFSFASGVNQAARISWNGGKPWNMALNDALAPLGLGARITDKVVRVAPMQEIAAMTPPAPAFSPTMPVLDHSPSATPVREVYVRRNGSAQETGDRTPGSAETLAPSAGGPVAGDDVEEPSFWSRLGLTPDRKQPPLNTQASGASATAPLLTAPDVPVARQPISLTGGDTVQASPAVVQSAARQGVMDPYDVRFWQAEKGDSLKNVLATWSDSAGVELYWVSTEDYVLPQAVRTHGNYTEAVTQILSSYGDQGKRPLGRLHPNLPTGPSVLIIEPSQN